jgi:hypothetical protein
MEYAGAVEVLPPFRGSAQDWVRASGWTPSADGKTIRPRGGISLDECIGSLRALIALDAAERSYAGVVAAYDTSSRELVTVSVRDGRVTRRIVRRSAASGEDSNVIDLATHPRTSSRRIS